MYNKCYRFLWKSIQKVSVLHTNGFTLIAQNCVGGVMYHDLGLKFLSPTINTLIQGDDFVRLCSSFEDYMAAPPHFNRWDSSPAYQRHPVLQVKDIEVHFPHCTTSEEALQSWIKRSKCCSTGEIFYCHNVGFGLRLCYR